ncbi:transcriptional regulator, AraC family protein [Oceanicola granulosus HTCC2516]|uniref:Transcriptional regulator, AraC family protein n=1 Tax=Oceanicola granulosus (strain ATCC BAA-861 / DSM 15982 / KCTC 12143 / HTCC2516) TaxID=314256 RepID=Q2CGL8_OCEGH|nr:helix-turn-helix domain-containing protein [Oceanicola granulosus]EAR51917.1 transcriptional regulator, AraC family protein [Oceanicola granulosus HTCC2516]
MTPTLSGCLVVERDRSHRLQAEDFVQLETVFNLLPKVILYIKDNSRRWVTCNRAALTLLRKRSHAEIVGAREEDFFPEAVAQAIKEDDLRILGHGERIVDRVELIANEHGQLVWASTSKLPIQNGAGDVLGLVGLTQLLDVNTELPPRFEKFRDVIRKIEAALETPPTVPELAAMANMSESHFRRSFKQVFGVAPQEFILQQRLRQAATLLTRTNRSIAQVALTCGFGDQSHFSRQFRRFFGESPRSYRLHWR